MTDFEIIRELLHAKSAALMSQTPTALERILHPAFIYLNASGTRLDKQDYIAGYCTSGQVAFLSQKTSGLKVQSFGDFAVATMNVDDVLMIGGSQRMQANVSMCVFAKVDDEWYWAAGQTMARDDMSF